MQAYLWVGAGGALGAMGRYGTGVLIGHYLRTEFPLATFAVNVIGSLLMGVLIGVLARTTPEWQSEARLFVAVGMFGGFTTFSSFSLDAVTLIERGEGALAATYILLSVLVSIAALFAGLYLVRSVPV